MGGKGRSADITRQSQETLIRFVGMSNMWLNILCKIIIVNNRGNKKS